MDKLMGELTVMQAGVGKATLTTVTCHFQHHRVAAVFLEGSLPHTSAAVKADWLSAGTATRKARGWGADLPRKANGAWLGLCEMPIKPSSPDAFNCLIPKWS